MNINRHNYEEFFILYWDKELRADQMKLVENFVEANIELKEEFRLFGETRFTPEKNLIFEEKNILLINEVSSIDFSNTPEQLLSYIDDELDAGQKKAVEIFAAKHATVQQELNLLKRTKLQPESSIVFPDKSTLYKKEVKTKVVNISWMRVAVAAALILVAGFVTIIVINNNSNGGPFELISAEQTPNIQPITPLVNNPQPTVEVKKAVPVIANKNFKKETQKLTTENLIAKNNVVADTENKNNLPNEKSSIDQSFPENIDIDNNAIETAKQKQIDKLFENTIVTERPAPSYAIYDASDDPNVHVDKGGLKGLLRKATRVFERRTKIQTTTDDDKLLIGVFAVSLK